MKIKINEDVCQWQTVNHLVNWIYDNNIELPPFIVDIGAADGRLNSNSWNFVVDNGWHGILVEPNPVAIKELYENYNSRAFLDHVLVVEAAISNKNERVELFLPRDSKDDQLASLYPTSKQHVKTVIVQAIRPKELPVDGKDIGILTVDTEGNDLTVLTAWIEDRLPLPNIVITESWPHMGYRNIQKHTLLGRVGYRKILHCGENEIFYRA